MFHSIVTVPQYKTMTTGRWIYYITMIVLFIHLLLFPKETRRVKKSANRTKVGMNNTKHFTHLKVQLLHFIIIIIRITIMML